MPLSRNLGTLSSWNPLGLYRPVMGLFCLVCRMDPAHQTANYILRILCTKLISLTRLYRDSQSSELTIFQNILNSGHDLRPSIASRGVQCAVCSVQCAVCSVQCAVCSVLCAVCSVQCAVCSVQCARQSAHSAALSLSKMRNFNSLR